MTHFIVDTDPTPKEGLMEAHPVPEEARSEPSLGIEKITPEIAEKWLESYNIENRRLKSPVVDRYVRDIRSGSWDFTGDPIRFDTRGVMIDGQHRCRAIVITGVTMDVGVARGIKPSARVSIDSGSRRSKADALMIEGYKNTAVLGATVTLLEGLATGLYVHAGSNPRFTLTHAETLDLVGKYQTGGVLDDVERAVSNYKHIRLHPSVIAASRYLQRHASSPEEVEKFWEGVCFTAAPGDPRWTLRNWSAKAGTELAKRTSNKDSAVRLYATAVTWNAWRNGKNTRILPVAKSEERNEEGKIISSTVWREIPTII